MTFDFDLLGFLPPPRSLRYRKGSLLRKTPTLSLAGAFWRDYHSAQATARPGENSSEPARDTQPKTRNTSEHRPSRPVRRAELQ
jgi:hypothetical protein